MMLRWPPAGTPEWYRMVEQYHHMAAVDISRLWPDRDIIGDPPLNGTQFYTPGSSSSSGLSSSSSSSSGSSSAGPSSSGGSSGGGSIDSSGSYPPGVCVPTVVNVGYAGGLTGNVTCTYQGLDASLKHHWKGNGTVTGNTSTCGTGVSGSIYVILTEANFAGSSCTLVVSIDSVLGDWEHAGITSFSYPGTQVTASGNHRTCGAIPLNPAINITI